MNNLEQAFNSGFVKRTMEYGLSEKEAFDLLTTGGAAIGATLGALQHNSKDKQLGKKPQRLRNAAIGALAGGALGSVASHI